MRFLLPLFCTFALGLAGQAAKPNILVIYSDDHGWADLGAQGVNGDIRTPNLDQLARDGVRFARGYVSAPQCVPSRAGVITGRYQQRFGVEDNNKGPLPLEELTIAERLKPAGYVTGMVGKWHLDLTGKDKGKKEQRSQIDHMPHAQGFDEYFRGEMLRYYASHDLKSQPFADAPHLVNDNRFRVEVQTEAALAFLDRRAAKPEQPWFLYLAWFAPHVPLESPEPWFSRTPAHLPKERRQALAMIACMDEGLGRIREKLRQQGHEQNTLLFFVGDNGAPVKPGAWDGSVNLPLIGEKGMLTDGGIRTPFLAAWPGTLPAGTIFESPVINLDIAATAVALAGQPKGNLDGVNLMPFLTGQNKAAPHDLLFWRWRSQAAVLEFPWKLIHLGPTERYLFDVTNPEGERKNLLGNHPDIASRLEARLQRWSLELKPPGLPQESNTQDLTFFADHVDAKLAPAAKPAKDEPGSIQGWVCRNGSIALTPSGLSIQPAGKGQAFLTRTKLNQPGPVTLTIHASIPSGGAGAITWREQGQDDFVSSQRVSFDWPADKSIREIKLTLPNQKALVHLRLLLPANAQALMIQSIALEGEKSSKQTWQFAPVP